MPEQKYLLIFTHHGLLFAFDSLIVRKILYLPYLTPVEEAPLCVAGVFNLRGKIIPAIDLNILFRHKPESYRLTDSVIIIEVKGFTIGVIVNDVRDIVSVDESEIEPAPTYEKREDIHPHFIKGEAKVGEEIIMVLGHDTISEFGIRNSESKAIISHSALAIPHSEDSASRTPHSAFEKFSPEELAVFHSRAHALMQPTEELTISGQMPLSVVSLNNEFYGISLDIIREFSEIKDITPVPCTPPHIVGNMNLRGDILTVVDIRGILNLPSEEFVSREAYLMKRETNNEMRDTRYASRTSKGKAVIAQVNGLVVGITVDDVLEVINITQSMLRPVPAAVSDIRHEFIKGEFPYNEKMVNIIDLKKILTNEKLVVDEEA